MSRMLNIGLVLVVISSVASVAYSQCGCGSPQGVYRPPYRSFWFPLYAPPLQPYYYQPQFSGYQPYYGGGPIYGVPQGSGMRSGPVPQTFQGAPVYPSAPAYSTPVPDISAPVPDVSAPQGSGSRSTPSQGSGSR